MAITNEELLIAIKADTTNLMSGLKTAGKGVTDFKDTISGIGKKMTITGALITAGVVKTFKDFTNYETKLVDMAKVTGESFEEIENKIEGIDPVLGNSTELMEGYYQTISAGVKDPIEALKTLTVAAEAGKASHTDQAEVVKGLTKMLAGYEGKIKDVSTAADLLFSIEKEGQTTVGELIPVIGGLAKISSDLNVEQEAMAGSMALITQTAGSTPEAATQYEALMTGMMKPTTEMTEALEQMGDGYANAADAIKDKGLVEVLKGLEEHMEATGITAGELFGRKEAMMAFSALGAEGFKKLDDTIISVGEGAGSAKKAFEEWSETGEATITGLKNTFSNFSMDVGEKLAPMIKNLLEGITDIISKISEWAKAHPDLFEAITKLGVVIGGICVVGGPLLLAISALSGIGGAITAIGTVATGPIGLLILAVGALAWAWKNDFGGIQDKVKSVIGFVKELFSGFIDFMKNIKDKISKIIEGIIEAIGKVKKALTKGVTVGPELKEGWAPGGAGVPSHQKGISYVPETGLALLHEGEAVIPKGQNQKGYKNIVNIYNPVVRNDDDISKIREQVQEVMNGMSREFGRSGNVLYPGIS